MSTEENLIDYVVEDEEIQKKGREVVLKGLKEYAKSDDYQLLLQYDPQLATNLIKSDLTIRFGEAPLIQMLKFKGLAWGEKYHYTSDHRKFVDAKIRTPFESDPYLFLLNYDKVSPAILKTALQFYDVDLPTSKVIDFSEANLRRILKSAGKDALDDMVAGWSNVYASIDQNTDVEYEELTEKKYLYVNPVYAVIPDEKSVKDTFIGYLGAKDTIVFYPDSIGKNAKDMTEWSLKERKKKIAKAVVSTIVTLGVAIAIALFILLK